MSDRLVAKRAGQRSCQSRILTMGRKARISGSDGPVKPSQKSYRAVTRRYRPPGRVNANTLRLRAVVALFRLSASEIARATGFSRPYVSRCLSGDHLIPSPEFLRKLERQLGTIIDGRTSQFFTIPAVPVARARNVMEQLPADEVAAVSEVDRTA